MINPISAIALFYFFFTIASSSFLYWSFRKKIDSSAIYFLISESSIACVSAALILTNMKLVNVTPFSIWVPNFGALIAELAILFGILSIRGNPKLYIFYLLAIFFGLLTFGLEQVRTSETSNSIILFHAIILSCLFSINYLVCRFRIFPTLKNNQFLLLFCWFELGLIGYGLLRIAASIANHPLVPRDKVSDGTVFALILFALLSSLRYVCYIGFRINWVDPNNPTENFLNLSLAKTTEEKNQFLQKLIASNRVLGISALASSLAHQLSQPLTTISFRAETARRDLIESNQSPHLIASLDEIKTQSGKLATLVHSLRRLFGEKNNQFHPINLKEAIEELLAIILPTLESNKIELLTNYQSNVTVMGDSIQLQQVLINLINNAVEAMSNIETQRKVISIAIGQSNKSAVITISDNGPGIEPQLFSSIFDLYNTTKKNGLGVGLWLSKIILEKHHGMITASNNANGGAMFKIEIPTHSFK